MPGGTNGFHYDTEASGSGVGSGAGSSFFLPLNWDATDLYSSTSAATLPIAADAASDGAISLTVITRFKCGASSSGGKGGQGQAKT